MFFFDQPFLSRKRAEDDGKSADHGAPSPMGDEDGLQLRRSLQLMFSAVSKEIGSIIGTHDATKLRKAGKGLTCFPPELALEAGLLTVDVDLSNNAIAEIPAFIAKLAALTTLNLSGNQLSSLPSQFAKMGALVHLDLSFNDLAVFPVEVCSVRTLEVLDLRNNQIDSLPCGICRLKSLKVLNVKSNALTRLPECTTRLTGLLELDFSDNQVEELPVDLGSMTSLVRLSATFNQIRSIPESIKHCTGLVAVRLAANKLTHVPHEVGYLPRLSWFSMASCPASLPPPEAHEGLREVTMDELKVGKVVKVGASSTVHAAKIFDQQAAVKIFKQAQGSQGRSADEMAITSALDHPNCSHVLAVVSGQQAALALEHFPGKPLEAGNAARYDPSELSPGE